MTAMPIIGDWTPTARTAPVPTALPQINHLRLVAMRCRSSARIDLFEACALLAHERETAALAFAEALLRGLRQALGRTPVFHAPGTTELSFDEAWLMRCLDRARAGDIDSLTFLLRRQVRPEAARSLGFLITNMAERLDTL